MLSASLFLNAWFLGKGRPLGNPLGLGLLRILGFNNGFLVLDILCSVVV